MGGIWLWMIRPVLCMAASISSYHFFAPYSIAICNFLSLELRLLICAFFLRRWFNHWCGGLYSCWDGCEGAFWTSPYPFIPDSWDSSCSIRLLLCGACKPMPISRKCLSLHLYLCRRRVICHTLCHNSNIAFCI